MKKQKSRAQVWVETVIYTLIGLAVIGILLAAAKPKIDSMKDKLLIEQVIDSLNNLNSKIYEVQKAPGNKRVIDVMISKGELFIDAKEDEIYWILDSKYEYSEPGSVVSVGGLKVLTKEAGPWEVKIEINDIGVDLRLDGTEVLKQVSEASSPYVLSVENMGSEGGLVVVDVVVG